MPEQYYRSMRTADGLPDGQLPLVGSPECPSLHASLSNAEVEDLLLEDEAEHLLGREPRS